MYGKGVTRMYDNRSMWLVQLSTWERARMNAQSQADHAQAEVKRWLTKLRDDGMPMEDVIEYLEEEDRDGE